VTRVLLLRAWLDTSSLPGGQGYYSPLEGGCATLIPIPEEHVNRGDYPREALDPRVARSPCSGRSLDNYMPLGRGWLLHNDPRLDMEPGFYTDYYAPQGRLPRSPERGLRPGDLLLFAAGLAQYPRGFWERRRRLTEILRAFREARERGGLGVYLVGGLRVEKVIDVSRTGWERALELAPVLRYSPHLYRDGDRPVAVVGEPLATGEPVLLARPAAGRLCGEPTPLLIGLLGRRAAEAFLRQNCRRARVVTVEGERLARLGLGR